MQATLRRSTCSRASKAGVSEISVRNIRLWSTLYRTNCLECSWNQIVQHIWCVTFLNVSRVPLYERGAHSYCPSASTFWPRSQPLHYPWHHRRVHWKTVLWPAWITAVISTSTLETCPALFLLQLIGLTDVKAALEPLEMIHSFMVSACWISLIGDALPWRSWDDRWNKRNDVSV